ncbi:MAG: hypothetical protein EA362_13265 [Saprospirales bacterium]|nr:MAG: hypothetical protein EA362_13265 [Saprospirales bacterium]
MNEKLTSAFQHLRIRFSFFLMPVYFLALSTSGELDFTTALLGFIILHLLIYPASNGYNSLMDQDTGSIGGLENPPEAPRVLYPITLIMDGLGLLLAYLVSPPAALLLLAYILASRLYSWRAVRIKKYPILGFLWVIIFQGAMTYWFCISLFQQEINIFSQTSSQHLSAMILASAMIASTYPLTQVYQHEQDRKDGIFTISMLLGIKNTFKFSGLMIMVFTLFLAGYLISFERWYDIFIFLILNIPASWHFYTWNKKVKSNSNNANYKNTMRMSLLGAGGANLFFIYLSLMNIL